MFERPSTGETAVLFHLSAFSNKDDVQELYELAVSAGVTPVSCLTSSRRIPDPRSFVGKGKLAEIQESIREFSADLVLVNHALSPGQERNLEQALGVRVVDRNGLILDIFAQRAKSFEGKLQVELAQLQHLSTRLIRGWTHLERQKGGIGLRGPGETQLETDRRLIGIRMRQIRRRLEKVDQQRSQNRQSRMKADIPIIGLVGYTNAGKSTLFNALTGAQAYAANKLFATLDATLRRFEVSTGSPVILADTVGFIRHLPHELVAAFRSTLQEIGHAQLLLHVVDDSSEEKETNISHVNQVLKDIGADQIPQLLVYNKADLSGRDLSTSENRLKNARNRIWVSALKREGLADLQTALCAFFDDEIVQRYLYLTPQQGKVRAKVFAYARVIEDSQIDVGGWQMAVEIRKKDLGLLKDVRILEKLKPLTA